MPPPFLYDIPPIPLDAFESFLAYFDESFLDTSMIRALAR